MATEEFSVRQKRTAGVPAELTAGLAQETQGVADGATEREVRTAGRPGVLNPSLPRTALSGIQLSFQEWVAVSGARQL